MEENFRHCMRPAYKEFLKVLAGSSQISNEWAVQGGVIATAKLETFVLDYFAALQNKTKPWGRSRAPGAVLDLLTSLWARYRLRAA